MCANQICDNFNGFFYKVFYVQLYKNTTRISFKMKSMLHFVICTLWEKLPNLVHGRKWKLNLAKTPINCLRIRSLVYQIQWHNEAFEITSQYLLFSTGIPLVGVSKESNPDPKTMLAVKARQHFARSKTSNLMTESFIVQNAYLFKQGKNMQFKFQSHLHHDTSQRWCVRLTLLEAPR